MKLTREFYKLDKLAGAKIYIPTEVDGLEFCLYEHNSGAWKDGELVNDHYLAQCFRGKQTKPAWHYNFGNSNECYSNFDYQRKGEVLLPDSLGYNMVEIVYNDGAGNSYSTLRGIQKANEWGGVLF